MSVPAPHFLLFSESRRRSETSPPSDWRFVLQSLDGSSRLEAADAEPTLGGERLELLAVVRGLEALEQPSRVTLVTPSKYVSRGLSYGLNDWRENDWNWEHHGQMVPIKNRDLWQRLDRALAYHRVQCRTAGAEVGGRGQGPGDRNEEIVSAPKPLAAAVPEARAASHAEASQAERSLPRWSEMVRLIGKRVAAFFGHLKARVSEIESPAGRWRIS